MEEIILFTGGGEAIILSTGDKCEYNLSYYFLDSGNEYREEITKKQQISSEVYSDEFEGRKKYNLILKITKSQQNGNVCRLIVSKSVLIKHVSRGEVFQDWQLGLLKMFKDRFFNITVKWYLVGHSRTLPLFHEWSSKPCTNF